MHTALGAARDIPDDPGVDVAKQDFALFCFFTDTLNIVEDPLDLGTGEVGRQGQTDFFSEAILAAVIGQFIADLVSAGILPDDGIVNRFAG